MRVEVGPTAEMRFTRRPVELTRVMFQKRCRTGVCASSFIIGFIRALLFVMKAGLLDRVLLPVAPKHWQLLESGEERFMISNFFFGGLVGNFCALCV